MLDGEHNTTKDTNYRLRKFQILDPEHTTKLSLFIPKSLPYMLNQVSLELMMLFHPLIQFASISCLQPFLGSHFSLPILVGPSLLSTNSLE